ncbi:hypothetical protein [Prevotella sp. HMSC077E09]|uniref:hypothetical protein n=1 Tax=Prevotella sp. HMSC077E09 TaxID=1739487 RepID=UPI00352ECDE6
MHLDEQLQGAVSLVAHAVQFLQIGRSFLLSRQVERLVLLGHGRLERFQHRLDFLNGRLFTHRDDVAGKLEVLHVVEPI